MAEDRRSAIGGERVGARLGRLLQRNRSQEEQDVLDAYRRQVPVSEIRRQRETSSRSRMGGESSGMAESAQAGLEAIEARPARQMMEASPPDEVAAALSRSRAQRNQRRPNTRMSPRPAPSEMLAADALNQRELDRIRAEREAEESRSSAAQRAESMGGSGDIGAASARARGEQVGPPGDYNMKKGGAVKKMAKGGVVKKMATGGASRRGDGCAARGKTKGRMV